MKFDADTVVIDADIARSVGESEHPFSSNSRKLLNTIKDDSTLKIAFCPKLKHEWDKHQSNFSLRWRASMVAKKRMLHLHTEAVTVIAIQNANISDKQKQIAEKDAHLVDLALASEQFIVSNDKTASDVFCIIADNSNDLNCLIWVIPNETLDALIIIIKQSRMHIEKRRG